MVTDSELARAYLDGDEDAFRALIDRYANPLFRFAQRFTNNADDSEDIVQECFIRLHTSLPKLRLDEPLKPWLYRVCANLCHNLARDKRSLNFSQLEETNDAGDVVSFVDQIPDSGETADIAMDRSLETERVRTAMEALPPKYRTILSLFYSDGLSYEEIGSVLRLPLNTVRTHLKRAKDRLKRELSSPAPHA